MINYLTHKEIDKTKWDECISHSLNPLVYAYSWYLDQAAPRWDALVLDDYEAVFPLVHGKKYLFSYLYQPLFIQQLGLFYKTLLGADHLPDFIKAIPAKFRFIDMALNEANLVEDETDVVKRKNYVLDLSRPYAKLLKNYSDHTKRNIGKAKKAELSTMHVEPEQVIKLYIEQKGKDTQRVVSADYKRFLSITRAVSTHAVLRSVGVYNAHHVLLAGGLFALSNNRLVYLMGASGKEGRQQCAMFLLLDQVISEYSEQPVTLDFEGSEIPGVARFFKGFGARKQPYYKLRINRLPWYIKWLKK